MKALKAQNGLEYSVDLVFTISMESNEYRWFQLLFSNLVTCSYKISDEGIIIQFIININEEIGKMGRFKDVPSKTEIKRYMPIVLSSDTFLKSDLVFAQNVIEYYIEKEKNKGVKYPEEVDILKTKLGEITSKYDIKINNLILSKKKKP